MLKIENELKFCEFRDEFGFLSVDRFNHLLSNINENSTVEKRPNSAENGNISIDLREEENYSIELTVEEDDSVEFVAMASPFVTVRKQKTPRNRRVVLIDSSEEGEKEEEEKENNKEPRDLLSVLESLAIDDGPVPVASVDDDSNESPSKQGTFEGGEEEESVVLTRRQIPIGSKLRIDSSSEDDQGDVTQDEEEEEKENDSPLFNRIRGIRSRKPIVESSDEEQDDEEYESSFIDDECDDSFGELKDENEKETEEKEKENHLQENRQFDEDFDGVLGPAKPAKINVWTPSRTPPSKTPAPLKTPAATPNRTMFNREREKAAIEFYKECNERAFGGKLPNDLVIVWSAKLLTTAGRAITTKRTNLATKHVTYSASIELSTKVLDSHEKLQSTLAHEMCHVAAWLINNNNKPAHGPFFKFWAQKVEKAYKNIQVSTCHNYEIAYKYWYQCTNPKCNRRYGRHSKSIDIESFGCGMCHSKLKLMERLKKDGTPMKPNPFALFIKENRERIRRENPGFEWAEIQKRLAEEYRMSKNL